MNKRIPLLLIAVCLLLGAFFYFKNNSFDTSEHERFDAQLRRLRLVDTAFNEDVLKARFRMLNDYDVFIEHLNAMDSALTAMQTAPAFLSDANRAETESQRAKVAEALAEKSRQLEEFKSQNAVLNNSLRYFPVAGQDLLNRLGDGPGTRELESIFNDLLREVLIYSVNATEELTPQIQVSLDRLKEWQQHNPGHSESVLLGTLTAHVKAILTRKPKVDSLTRQILAQPTGTLVDDLTRFYETRFSIAFRNAELYRFSLKLVCLILTGAIIYTLIALRRANRTLEHRVADRTASLAASEERFRLAAQCTSDVIWEWDVATDRVGWFGRIGELLGLTSDRLPRTVNDFLGLVHPEDAERLQESLQRHLSGNDPSKAEYRIRHEDGSYRWWTVNGIVAGTNGTRKMYGASTDVTERKRTEKELDKAHTDLVKTSRLAGMAEVATSVLHNVGNALNSVNVSSTVLGDLVKNSRADNVGRVATLLRENESDLGTFLTQDPKGRQLPTFLSQLAETLGQEQTSLLGELGSLRKNIEHIRDIVVMQQSYGKIASVVELVKVTDLIEDALRLNAGALVRHDVKLNRQFDIDLPEVRVDKHKVLQILVNLISNAKYACDDAVRTDKLVTVAATYGNGTIRIAVSDNGVGIPRENLTRIFSHGFTTRKNGHGFGLHNSALAARDMGGSLVVSSEGRGCGATFTLHLPLQPVEEPAEAAK